MSTVQIRFSGSGGQGLQLAARILAETLAAGGRRIALSQAYEPTSRGGLSRADVVVSDAAGGYPLVTRLDYLVILDQVAAAASTALVDDATTVIADSDRVNAPPRGGRLLHLPIVELARRCGSERAANVVSLGALAAVSSIGRRDDFVDGVRRNVPARFEDMNLDAFLRGYEMNTAEMSAASER